MKYLVALHTSEVFMNDYESKRLGLASLMLMKQMNIGCLHNLATGMTGECKRNYCINNFCIITVENKHSL
jgi:hypothetical protein